jgi:arginase family enzyme
MRTALLHLDGALHLQHELRRRVADEGGLDLECRDLGPALRLWSRPAALDRLSERLGAALPVDRGPTLVFGGSGDFHHVTALLLERACQAAGDEAMTVVHFDNHPDWVRHGAGLHCGSWVGRAARLPGVARVLTIGVCSSDIDHPDPRSADLALLDERRVELYAYRGPGARAFVHLCGRRWPTISGMGEAAFATFAAGRIQTDAVYVTIDKDVLRAQDAATNWDQGQTSLALLKNLVRAVTDGRRLVGADVVGDWSPATYGGGPLDVALKRGEAMLDQPWSRPSEAARAANETVNLDLLDLFADIVR